jgi:hypothetical protein
MQSSLAYIDKAGERQIAKRQEGASAVSEKTRADLRKQATKPIAGFDIYDEEEEKRLLDAQIAKQRAALDAFVKDRGEIRDKLERAGIIPLAVVPRAAWQALCVKGGLFLLNPDSSGRVRINTRSFDGLGAGSRKASWAGPTIIPDEAEELARKDWTGWLKRLFPDNTDASNGGAYATLVLPIPPADVMQTLLKASRGGFAMKTAAVPEAISFKETIPQLRNMETARREEEARRLEAARRDPIIYTEHGTATAVLAQFGDFPIEQELVDAVVEADDFIPEEPTEVQYLTGATTLTGVYGSGRGGGSSFAMIQAGLSPQQIAQIYQSALQNQAAGFANGTLLGTYT